MLILKTSFPEANVNRPIWNTFNTNLEAAQHDWIERIPCSKLNTSTFCKMKKPPSPKKILQNHSWIDHNNTKSKFYLYILSS